MNRPEVTRLVAPSRWILRHVLTEFNIAPTLLTTLPVTGSNRLAKREVAMHATLLGLTSDRAPTVLPGAQRRGARNPS